MSKAPQFTPGGRIRDWARLRSLLDRAEGRSLNALTDAELWELPGLYRKAIADLSLLNASGAPPETIQDLAGLCSRGHALVYRETAQRRGPGLGNYLLNELPRVVRRRLGYLLAAAAVMVLFTVLGYIHCATDPKLAQTILSPQMVGQVRTSLRTASKQADLKLAAQIPKEDRNAMALMITFNNISVAVKGFVSGLLGGVPTLFVLGFNGYMLGAIGWIYCNTEPGIPINLPLYFYAGIAPHGSIELPAICLACAAGMLIGFAWLFPAGKGRGDALRAVAPDAGAMVVATAVTLVVAGSIEGFVTPLECPAGLPLETWFWAKIVFGGVVFLCWFAWLSLGGRRAVVER